MLLHLHTLEHKCSTVEGVISYMGQYHQYFGEYSAPWGKPSVLWRVFGTSGDIINTVEKILKVLVVSLQSSRYPPRTDGLPPQY